MLQVSYIKDNFSNVVSNLNKRNIDFTKLLQEIIELDDLRKKNQTEYDSILNESNTIAKEIGILFKSGKGSEAEELKSKSISLKPKAKELQEKLNKVSEELKLKLCSIPNIPNDLVVKGMSRGNKMGFPTANIQVIDKNKIIPKNGVYLVSSKIENKLYYGMMNIGYNPTFGNHEKSIEVNFFDFNSNLYNKTLTIEFIKYIREEIEFKNINELIKKLNNDREYCLKHINSIINN